MGSKTSKECEKKQHTPNCQTAEGAKICENCCDKIKYTCGGCKRRTEDPYSVVNFYIPHGTAFRGRSGAGRPYCKGCASKLASMEVDGVFMVIC